MGRVELLRLVAGADDDADALAACLDGDDRRFLEQDDTLLAQTAECDVGQFGIGLGEGLARIDDASPRSRGRR